MKYTLCLNSVPAQSKYSISHALNKMKQIDRHIDRKITAVIWKLVSIDNIPSRESLTRPTLGSPMRKYLLLVHIRPCASMITVSTGKFWGKLASLQGR